MTIREFIIHRIDKEQHKDPQPTLRKKALSARNSKVAKFTELAVNVFAVQEDRPNCIFAHFNDNRNDYPFASWCELYFQKTLSFVDFTRQGTGRLATCMKQQTLSTGGFVVFSRFQREGIDQLLIVMLHSQDGLSIDENMELQDVTHLELKQIDKAALITVPDNGKFGDEKALTYAGVRKKMSQYFQEFLGPDAFRHPAKDTRVLMGAVDNYTHEKGFGPEKCAEIRANLRRYAKDQAANNEELNLDAVSAIVNPAEPRGFATFATNQRVSAHIKPDLGVFKRWKVIKHTSADGVAIQFPAEAVGLEGTAHRLIFNPEESSLTINRLDDALVEKLKETCMPAVDSAQ